MKTRIPAAIVVLCLFSFALPFYPQSTTSKTQQPGPNTAEPTLTETLDWIKTKIGLTNCTDELISGTHEGFLLDFNECSITLPFWINIFNFCTEKNIYIFKINDIDYSSIKYQAPTKANTCGYIYLSTVKSDYLIEKRWEAYKYNTNSLEKTGGGKENSFKFACSPELGERFVKAWKHAVKLCGGKETKEIF